MQACELLRLRASLLRLLGSAHPALSDVAHFCAADPREQLRPQLVLLFARATNGLGPSWHAKQRAAPADDPALSRPGVLPNAHPSMPTHTASFAGVFHLRPPGLYAPSPAPAATALANPPSLLPTQRRLAQIVDMIHVASVLHDDVRDAPAGNKLSILAGDFLLGRASAALARLGDAQVVELLASVIANQAQGEMINVHDTESYLAKIYLKTASLMAKGACAAVVLGGCTRDTAVWRDVAYAYGRNLGIARQ
ncbi:hypothetical protein C0992_008339, partial [Termitomyces sp. T32_za158]